MRFVNKLYDYLGNVINKNNSVSTSIYSIDNSSPQSLYLKLKEYYQNNNLYQKEVYYGYSSDVWVESIRPLRTVVNRSVEFYTARVCPNEVAVSTDNNSVKEAIEQFFKWSNFDSQKRLSIRELALYGNLFWKIVTSEDRVYFEIIEPYYVTEFNTDHRGYITEIRIDIPKELNGRKVCYVEYWNKEEGYCAIWENALENTKLEQLGEPDSYIELSEFGIDFIPIVHIKFKDIGEKIGASCVLHALAKIDEANRQATRLHQILFRNNKPLWAVRANSVDKDGFPIPPPKIKSSDGTVSSDVEIKDNSIIYLPGNSSLESLIPDIKYADALEILRDMVNEIEKDLPELSYYTMKETDASGKSIKLQLSAAIDRAEEAKDNFLTGLERLNQMALTIGKYLGIFPLVTGNYENGDFDHSLQTGSVFTRDDQEIANLVKTYVEAGLNISTALRIGGFSEEEIAQAIEEKTQEDARQQNLLANSLMNFNRG